MSLRVYGRRETPLATASPSPRVVSGLRRSRARAEAVALAALLTHGAAVIVAVRADRNRLLVVVATVAAALAAAAVRADGTSRATTARALRRRSKMVVEELEKRGEHGASRSLRQDVSRVVHVSLLYTL